MNRKIKYNAFLASLFAAMLFTACADEISMDENPREATDTNLSELVCFSSDLDDEGTRTAMFPNGRFKWVNKDTIVDKIFVLDTDNVSKKLHYADSMQIVDDSCTQAKFFLKGAFDKSEYPILYAGSNPNMPEDTAATLTVTIPAEQIQSTPNNSDHFGMSGDCGVAKARKKQNGGYNFKLEHQMAYLMLEPRMNLEGTRGWIKKIKITELGKKSIRGTFVLGANGIKNDDADIVDGDSVITIYCGSKDTKDRGFPIVCYKEGDPGYVAGNKYAQYDDENGKDNSRIYVVIRPGKDYQLKIDYEVVSKKHYQQKAQHKDGTTGWNWNPDTTGYSEMVSKTIATRDFNANCYYKIRHAFNEPVPVIKDEHKYKFEEYYMWGAKRWFWNGIASYPVDYDEAQSENAPEYTGSNDSRWFYVNTTQGDRVGNAYEPYNWKSDFTISGGQYRSQQANSQGLAWSQTLDTNTGRGGALTANEASFYVVYGDAHYDNTTPWTLAKYRRYNGYPGSKDTLMVCYGGIWLKKRAKIAEASGLLWPDRFKDNETTTNLAAPFIHDTASGQNNQVFEGVRYNLRWCAPWSNYRHTYTNYADFEANKDTNDGKFKKPWELDPSKKEEDYFFVPALGRIEYQHPDHPNVPTFTLTGAQGFYWTRTPVAYNFGGTSYYFNSSSPWSPSYTGNFNAFYLNIHYSYFALSWQQEGQYVKTGMRVASDAMFE